MPISLTSQKELSAHGKIGGNGNATDNKKCNVAKKKSVSIKKKSQPSWIKIEQEYISDVSRKPITLERMANKYDIKFQTLANYSMENAWSEKRKNYKKTMNEKAMEKAIDKLSDREARTT